MPDATIPDPGGYRWRVTGGGRQWYVENGVDYHRTRPCNYGPIGRVITYRTSTSAQRKADQLNAE